MAAYLWKSDGTDAELLDGNKTRSIPVVDSGGREAWHYVPSREQCLACHEPSPAFILGFSEVQLNNALPDQSETQLVKLHDLGVLEDLPSTDPDKVIDAHVPTRMVKGYVQGNCVHCHNGGIAIDFSHRNFLGNTINVTGRDGTLVIPGDPEQSSFYRLFSEGKMPPLKSAAFIHGRSQLLDYEAINLIYDWILNLG